MSQPKQHKIISLSIQLLIVCVAFYFIYTETFHNKSFYEIISYFKYTFHKTSFFLLVVAFVLLFFNWGIEAWKWKLLIAKVEQISFFRAFVATFSGVTVSIFTPNRIGEFLGRVFLLDKADRIQAALITIIGNMSQLLVTIVAGALGFVFFVQTSFQEADGYSNYLFYVLLILVAFMLMMLITFYLYSSLLTQIFNQWKWLNNYKKYIEIFAYYSPQDLLKVLLLSTARYAVFATQFYLLLLFFGIELSFANAMMLVSLCFFVTTIIPTFALTEMGVRGSVAIYFIGMFSANTIGILSSSFVLWLINLALPAMIGALFIFKLKFFRTKETVPSSEDKM